MTSAHLTVLDDPAAGATDGPLEAMYGAALQLPDSGVIANFVASIDGIVSVEETQQGSGAIVGGSEEDRVLMAMLRASCDAVVIGAGTLRADGWHQWTPWSPVPHLAAELRALRRRVRGALEPPPLVVVSARGGLPGDHPALLRPQTRVIVVAGRDADLTGLPRGCEVVRLAEPRAEARSLVETLASRFSMRLVLSEAGPMLFGALMDAGLVDELFLTVSPVLMGGAQGHRGVGMAIANPARMTLRTVRRGGDHLFLRYGRGSIASAPAS